jgi:hypothetical protein
MPSAKLIPVSTIPHPFKQERVTHHVVSGLTLQQMLMAIQPNPLLREHAIIYIGEHFIEKKYWHLIKPKINSIVSIKIIPKGGGFARIFAFAAVAVLAVVASVFLGPLGGLAVSVIGSLAVNLLLPPPKPQVAKDYGTVSNTYSISNSRNRTDVWGKVPFLLGQFRIVPPYAAQPYREVLGGLVYWRALFALGHGPILPQEVRIGNTNIAEFEGIEVETRIGYWSFNDKGSWNASSGVFPSGASFGDKYTVSVAGTVAGFPFTVGMTITYNAIFGEQNLYSWDQDQDKPFKFFGTDVYEDAFSAEVVQSTPVVRTTQANADGIWIDLVFDKGLVHLQNSPPGKPALSRVEIKIEQSPKGANTWSTVTQPIISGQQQNAMYWGIRWQPALFGTVPATKEFDVRITRISADFDETRNFGNFTWFSMKTETFNIQYGVPGVSYLAVRIKASGQLSGSLDEVNVIAQTLARRYVAETGQWTWGLTSNPAALFRHILQHPSRVSPAADNKIDIAKLTYWHEQCRINSRLFNGVYDYKTNVWDVLSDVAKVGRAIPSLRDLIFSVIIDEPKDTPVRMFTPRNCWNYHGELTHDDIPHAYRISFVNSLTGFVTDERIVYNDGYNASNATRIYKVDWIGITNPNQVWKEGRFHLAQQKLRREIHKITVDFEHLICERGDLVAFQHDAISVGLGTGRVLEITDNGTNALTITIDNGFAMEAAKSYGFRVRRVYGGQQITSLYEVDSDDGEFDTFTFTTPPLIADAPSIGDLVSFGELDTETLRLIVRDIIPKNDLSAELVLIPEAPGIHTSDTSLIPPFEPRVTFSFPPPTILSIQSDASVMLVTSTRFLITRVVFNIVPSTLDDVSYRVQFRQSNTDSQFTDAVIQESSPNYIKIIGVDSGLTYDFRITRTHPDYLTAASSLVKGYTVIGRSQLPQALQNLSVASVGGQALLQWELPGDLDVQYGGWIIFRHSPLTSGATWPNSTSIGRAVSGDQTFAYLPLKPGTYLATVYDVDGNPSEVSSVSTKQASVLTFVTEASIQEDPTFSGTKTDCEVVDDKLQLIAGNFDDSPSVDAEPNWDLTGAYVLGSGIYEFAAGMDFGSVKSVRLTLHISVEAENLVDEIDGNDLWDSLNDIDGVSGAPVDAQVFGKITDDDPSGSPTWSDFIKIDSVEVNCRAVGELECRMTTTNSNFNIHVIELRLIAERL